MNITDKLADALRAIQARINGEYDHPALQAYGALSTDAQADALGIADAALATVVAYDAQQPNAHTLMAHALQGTSPAGDHTAGPWFNTEDRDARGHMGMRIDSRDRFGLSLIAWVPYGEDYVRGQTHAWRIVACVNACKGLSTEQLESMDVGLLAHVWATTTGSKS